jgi:spore coat polysaccharide biosynthesis protein SpsF
MGTRRTSGAAKLALGLSGYFTVNVGIVVFSRFDSTRLPGKALRDIVGRPLLGRVLDRLHRVSPQLPVIVATSDRAVDDSIKAFATAESVSVFRGDEKDVAARAYSCAKHFNLTHIVRISGDSPFIPPQLIEKAVKLAESQPSDLITNIFPRSYPAGTSVEVIATSAMKRLLKATDNSNDREHVTRYFYRQPDDFTITNFTAENEGYDKVTLALDTAEDLERSQWMIRNTSALTESLPLEALISLALEWDQTK